MELLQMRYYNTVVKMGSMTAAAEALHVSQSTLSCSVKKLESELGTKLFQKQGRYLVCTEAGRCFYEKASVILQLAETLSAEIKALGERPEMLVRVASDVADISEESTALLKSSHPGYDVEIIRDQTIAGSHNEFLSGKADFLITSIELQAPGVSGQLILKDPVLLLVSTEHPLADRSEVSVKELENETFVSLGKGTSIRRLHDEILHQAGIRMPRFYIVNEPEVLPFIVSKNQGIAFLPQSVRNLQTMSDTSFVIRNITSVRLREDVATKNIYLYWKESADEPEVFQKYRSFIQWYGSYISTHGVRPHSLPVY